MQRIWWAGTVYFGFPLRRLRRMHCTSAPLRFLTFAPVLSEGGCFDGHGFALTAMGPRLIGPCKNAARTDADRLRPGAPGTTRPAQERETERGFEEPSSTLTGFASMNTYIRGVFASGSE